MNQIEMLVLNYLDDENLGYPVYLELPESVSNPDFAFSPFLIVQKTGSNQNGHLTTSTVAVQSYGATLYDAMQMNYQVIAWMLNITKLDEVTRVEVNSDYEFTDEATKRPRYQAVFDLTHYL